MLHEVKMPKPLTLSQSRRFHLCKTCGNEFYSPSGQSRCQVCIVESNRIIVAAIDADYNRRVESYEAQGITRSDAQGIVDAEDMKARA